MGLGHGGASTSGTAGTSPSQRTAPYTGAGDDARGFSPEPLEKEERRKGRKEERERNQEEIERENPAVASIL